MRAMTLAGTLALLTATSTPAFAQISVSADVVVGSGPVVGRVIIGNRGPYMDPHRYPARRVIARQPRVILVEHPRRRHHDARRFERGRHHGWQEARAWYDSRRHEYYDGYRPGLRETVVYQRGDRYYDDYDD